MDKQQGTLAAAPRRPTRTRQAARALVTACAAAVVVGAGLLAQAFLPVAPEPARVTQAPLQPAPPQGQPVAMPRPVQLESVAPPPVPLPTPVPAAAARAPAVDRHRVAKTARRAEAPRAVAAADKPRGGGKKVAMNASARQPASAVERAPQWPELGCDQQMRFARELCTAMRCATADFSRHTVCLRMQADHRAREQLARSMGAP